MPPRFSFNTDLTSSVNAPPSWSVQSIGEGVHLKQQLGPHMSPHEKQMHIYLMRKQKQTRHHWIKQVPKGQYSSNNNSPICPVSQVESTLNCKLLPSHGLLQGSRNMKAMWQQWVRPRSIWTGGNTSAASFTNLLHIVKDVLVVFREAFFIHPSVPSSINGWHHTEKKTLAEINNPPSPLCTCVTV